MTRSSNRIRPFTRHETVEHFARFQMLLHPGSGYSFECDEQGNIRNPEHAIKAQELRDDPGYRGPYIETQNGSWIDWGSVRCNCGVEHDLCGGDSDCDNCGQLFNAGGQELVPRSQWEERYDDDY
jgi:hypothetical protein